MPKTILFLADGTWNGPGQDKNDDGVPDPTNVFKLFGMLAGRDDLGTLTLHGEQERTLERDGRTVQVAKYLHGVGDSRNWLVRILGGAFGAGVVARIARGHTFVSRHYEPGDRIVLVGFSRGAYTARALGGLIAAEGLLDRNQVDVEDKTESYRAATAAWQRYRDQRGNAAQRDMLHDVVRDMPGFVQDDGVGDQLTGPVPVHCVAVWDTVGALGIPLYDDRDERIDAFQFCDCSLSAGVRRGYHAVAIDELRADFTPTLWKPREGIIQVLFAGAHADVGGGYPSVDGESDLSHVALEWMREQLATEGVVFADPAMPACYAGSHLGGSHQPWLKLPWLGAPTGERDLRDWQAKGLQLHPSVTARMEAGGPFRLYPRDSLTRYQPPNLRH